MTTEDKFRAAVNVIRGLPKKGSYTPSTDLMLTFYGYFKQATEGPNTTPKPYLWEVVKKVKWDSWNRLGDMSKEEAMLAYLGQLNKIVEEMAAAENVEDFLTGMDDFYAQVPAEDVDLCIGPTIQKIRARSSSPLPTPHIVPEEPIKTTTMNATDTKSDEEEDDFFLDSMDTIVLSDNVKAITREAEQLVYANGHAGAKKQEPLRENTGDILMKTVTTMRTELNEINACIKKIEQIQKLQSKGMKRLFGNLSPQTIAFITLWPIVINIGFIWLYSKRRNKN